MTPGTCAVLLGALLSAPAALGWLRSDLSAQDLLLRFGLATVLALGAVHVLVGIVSSYRQEPEDAGDPERVEERRSEAVTAAPPS